MRKMICCTATCRRWTIAVLSVVFLILGILSAAGWKALFDKIIKYELSLVNEHTIGYSMWKETPVPLNMQFFIFNWTNSEEFGKNHAKPHFDELGPYTFTEKHYRTNVRFNKNNTLTYQTKREWHFSPEETNGSLDDLIITLNPVVTVISQIVEPKHLLVKRGVNFFLKDTKSSLTVTKTVREFLFDGYSDELLEVSKRLNFKEDIIPFDKFGWFYNRNGSSDYDGVYNMENGGDGHYKTLGIFDMWNYKPTTLYYRGDCAKVKGTSGEYWYPTKDNPTVDIFAPDVCSYMTLEKSGTGSLHGINGNQYIGTEKIFDNGTKYPDMECFMTLGEELLSGLRNVSLCKFKAPSFVSYPHFYLADPAYRDAVDGLNPIPEEHRTTLLVEPDLGIPLHVRVGFQINLLLNPVEGIDDIANVNRTFMPMFWFRQTAQISESMGSELKLVLAMPSVGMYIGYALVALGVLLSCGFIFVLYKNNWSMRSGDKRQSHRSDG